MIIKTHLLIILKVLRGLGKLELEFTCKDFLMKLVLNKII
jgi:hypothetical protein